MVPKPNLSGDSIFLLHPSPLGQGVLPPTRCAHKHNQSTILDLQFLNQTNNNNKQTNLAQSLNHNNNKHTPT